MRCRGEMGWGQVADFGLPQVSAMVELKRIRDASSMGSAYLAAAVTSSAQ